MCEINFFYVIQGVSLSGKYCPLLSEVQQNKGEIAKWPKRRHFL